MRKAQIVGVAAALLIAVGSGVALFDGDRGGGPSTSTAKTASPVGAAADVAASGIAEAAQSPAARVTPGAARVVKTASLSLSVANERVGRVTDSVTGVAAQFGGFVASTQRDSGEARSSVVTIRVPAPQFDNAMVALRKLGKVSDEKVGGNDVTGQLVDLEARLRSLRAQEEALNGLMAKATTVGETLQVAQAVADVRTEIEQLAGQQHQLADQADYATITATVAAPGAVAPSEPKPDPVLVRSAKQAVGATLAVFGGVLVVLGVVVPLGALSLLAFGLWQVARRFRHPVTSGAGGTV